MSEQEQVETMVSEGATAQIEKEQTDFHVEVAPVINVTKHPNADTLSIGDCCGAPVIFRTGDFVEGQLAVYIPVDAVVPEGDPRWEHLGKHRRIKAKRIRDIYSQGILTQADPSWPVGFDAREALKIEKYEPALPAHFGTCGANLRDPGYMPIYGVESYRRFKGAFNDPNEEVVMTEKLHGCVPSDASISMADGSRTRLHNVVVGDEVMGYVDGRVVASKVLRKFSNGPAVRWLKITGKRRNAGRGNSYFSLRCTDEHRVWSPSKQTYIHARDLVVGDDVMSVRNDPALSPIQEQVLLGKMLGDGSLHSTKFSANMTWNHCADDRDYVEWTARAIGLLASEKRGEYISGYGSEMIRTTTINSAWIKERFDSFVSSSGTKFVPEWVATALTPLAVAFWYMDDGSLSHWEGQEDRASFATCGFTEADCNVLAQGLARLGINVVVRKHQEYWRIYVNAIDAERLFLLVAPYIPPCMQRKLPERYRGGLGWLPLTANEFKSMTVVQTIDAIEVDPSVNSDRFDMETESNNYFANGILVHNCNARYVSTNDRLHCASHYNYKQEDATDQWWAAAIKYNLAEKLATVPNVGLYAEVFGQVQDLRYGAKQGELFLRFYDAIDVATKRWYNYDELVALVTSLGLDMVPELYRGPWSPTKAVTLCEGMSMIPGANHIREGLVVKPVVNRFERTLGRVNLKVVGQGYLLRKTKD